MEAQKTGDSSIATVHAIEEKQWVRQVREANCQASFEQIFRTYYKRLHGFAFGYVERKECAEDIVQTVFLRIWANKDTWNPPGTLKHYLFAAVRNEALNKLRHQKIELDAEEDVFHTFKNLKSRVYIEDDTEVEELRKAIQHGIDQLPPRSRQIYLLNRRSGLTYREIADFLDISINTVSTQMGRTLKSLRKNLIDFIPLFMAIGLGKIL